MNVYLPNLRLPSAYQEVEYIQSTGTQYINTSIIPSDTKGIYMKMSSQDVTNDLVYFGSNVTAGGKIFGMGNVSSKIYYGWNGWLAAASRPSISADTIVELENNYMNSRKYKKDGVDVASISATMSSSGYGITIFGYNVSGSIQYPCKIKLYSCKISDGSSIVNNFIPCYRKSDNVIGLYDLVNNQFYTNAGTGTFSKGNDVTMAVLKNAYIGEYIEQTFTISNVPNDNSNVYVNIAKSGKTVKEVTFELTANNNGGTSSSGRDCYFRISGSNNTTNRYGGAAQFYNSGNVNTFKVLGRINNNADTEFKSGPSLQTNGINTLKLVIGRDGCTKIINGASESWTYTTAEKNIVDTIMNSSTINAYASREGGVTISTVNITVAYS